jgi:phage-related protein
LRKEVLFMGSSHDDLVDFPEEVRRQIGFALHLAQKGLKGLDVVPLLGFGNAQVLEVIANFRGDTYRAVYTVAFRGAVYMLHAFKKKSTSGRQTNRIDVATIRGRLKSARVHHENIITLPRRTHKGNA